MNKKKNKRYLLLFSVLVILVMTIPLIAGWIVYDLKKDKPQDQNRPMHPYYLNKEWKTRKITVWGTTELTSPKGGGVEIKITKDVNNGPFSTIKKFRHSGGNFNHTILLNSQPRLKFVVIQVRGNLKLMKSRIKIELANP